MTEREAKAFLNNLKVCIEEHPIVADWLVEIANRKTEPTISKMEQVDKDINVRSKDEPQTDLVLPSDSEAHKYNARLAIEEERLKS